MVEIHRHEQLLAQLRNNHPDGLSHSGDEGTAQLSELVSSLEEKIHRGCLIRSLESAFQVEAIDEEWNEWFVSQVDFFYFLKSKGLIPKDHIGADLLLQFKFFTMDYIKKLARNPTPMGKVLRKNSMSYRLVSPNRLITLIEEGKSVLVFLYGSKHQMQHVMHLGLEGDNLVQLSDSGQRVCLSEDQVCDVLVFTPNL